MGIFIRLGLVFENNKEDRHHLEDQVGDFLWNVDSRVNRTYHSAVLHIEGFTLIMRTLTSPSGVISVKCVPSNNHYHHKRGSAKVLYWPRDTGCNNLAAAKSMYCRLMRVLFMTWLDTLQPKKADSNISYEAQ
jgi:hypothetical protein